MMHILARFTGAGFLLLAVVVALAIWDLSNANRPHELKTTNFLMVLLAIGSAIGFKLVLELIQYWKIRKSVDWRLSRLMLIGAALMYIPLVAFLTTVVFTEALF